MSRVWHGWTIPANADAYESLLNSEIFTGIQNRQIAGYRGIHLFRRNVGDEVEFDSIGRFELLQGKTMRLRLSPQRRAHCFRDLMRARSIMKSKWIGRLLIQLMCFDE